MSIEVAPHPIPFLTEALTLGEINDFKPRLVKLMVEDDISENWKHPKLSECKTVLYDKGWYRGDAELTHNVSLVFLYWLERCSGKEALLKRAYQHFYLLGDHGTKFFGHLNTLYDVLRSHRK
ncbi:hypothetical protein FDJ25_gp140 [Vibrio phage Aphrodite1]|uniref:Uncharacterized protein n=1 Tax=Vibrio phage Aphrodite1 TaxID=2070057 RepID=A0A2I7QI73_9CAUD|nr:hypothetical protein FDJ25_gp140 [Vibrio phage Aphrodite1]AUR81078.1 hypothetical protein Aphrodite1_0061 [Vibrio phage Aphrodite1]